MSAGGDHVAVSAGAGVGDHHASGRIERRRRRRVGQVGLGPDGDKRGDVASPVRFADGMVDAVQHDERLGWFAAAKTRLASRAETTGSRGACRTRSGRRNGRGERGAGEPTVTTARTPVMDAAAARMAGPAAEWPMRSDGAPWLARSVPAARRTAVTSSSSAGAVPAGGGDDPRSTVSTAIPAAASAARKRAGRLRVFCPGARNAQIAKARGVPRAAGGYLRADLVGRAGLH